MNITANSFPNHKWQRVRVVLWIISGELALSQRPLRDHPQFGGRSSLPPEARPLVVDWVERIKDIRIQSVICLLEPDQLDRYYIQGELNLHEHGLLGYYKAQGLHVRHFPMTAARRLIELPRWLPSSTGLGVNSQVKPIYLAVTKASPGWQKNPIDHHSGRSPCPR